MDIRLIILVSSATFLNALTISPLERISDSPGLDKNDKPSEFKYVGGKLRRVTELGQMSTFDIETKQWSHTKFHPIDQTGYEEKLFSMGGRLFSLFLPLEIEQGRDWVTPKLHFWDDESSRFFHIPLDIHPRILHGVGSGYLRSVVTAPDQDNDQIAYICSSAPNDQPYGAISKLQVEFVEGVPISGSLKPVGVIFFPEQVFAAVLVVRADIIYVLVKDTFGIVKNDVIYKFNLNSGVASKKPLRGLLGTVSLWEESYVFDGQLMAFGVQWDEVGTEHDVTDETTSSTTESTTITTTYGTTESTKPDDSWATESTTESTTYGTTESSTYGTTAMAPRDTIVLPNTGSPNDGAIWSLDFATGQWELVGILPAWKGVIGYTVDQHNRFLYLINVEKGLYQCRIDL